MLNETWLKNNYSFNIKSYTIIRQDRDDGYGGLICGIKNNINFTIIKNLGNNVPDRFQYLVLKIRNINFINVYCPP